MNVTRLLFVCVENSNRSQMAEAFARLHGGERVVALSAGSKPSGSIHPKAVAAMREVGYDLARHASKSVDDLPDVEFDVAVTMGCGDACPRVRAKRREDWNISDPRDLGPEEFRAVRDGIESKVKALLAALVFAACASGPVKPVVDLTPFEWTWSQVSLGKTVIRYGFPKEPAATGDAAAFRLVPVGPGASETSLASFRYGCAREDREPDAPCTVFLDFRLLELEPPLSDVSLPAHRTRLERVYGDLPPRGGASELVHDSHGREWYHRALALGSGAAFAHYSRPIDARRALAVTSFTTRAPDRVAARDLARDAIDRAVIVSEPE